ncbi:hypothetical protein LN650_19065 [Klebsiella pneumoniae subsp. pneumoniae]|nr:hypothetical protein [Klebsiella pneumoniae subsp. pneumoniae]
MCAMSEACAGAAMVQSVPGSHRGLLGCRRQTGLSGQQQPRSAAQYVSNLFDTDYVASINKSGYRYHPGEPRTFYA